MLAVVYATCRASHARQVNSYDPDENGYLGPPGWRLGVGLTTPHRKNLFRNPAISFGKQKIENNGDWLLRRTRLSQGCSLERMEEY
jgi:hypothetical protein